MECYQSMQVTMHFRYKSSIGTDKKNNYNILSFGNEFCIESPLEISNNIIKKIYYCSNKRPVPYMVIAVC